VPEVYAGQDQTIAYGASATIGDATATGTQPLTYSWTPANLLLDPTVLNPTTVALPASVTFTLVVSDANGCESSDQVTITIEGSLLGVIATADPSEICIGESTQLFASVGGGTGNYTFTWTSNPPGFTSTLQNPIVTPTATTTYTVEVFDGFTTASASVTVTVYPLPIFNCPAYGPVCEGSNVIIFTEPGVFKLDGNVVTGFDPATAGIFTLSYIETSSHGCSDSCIFTITVDPLPDIYAGADQTIPHGTFTVISDATASGSAPLTYYWTPEELLVDPTVLIPTTTNLESTTTFTLLVTDANGCVNSDDVIIFIEGGPLALNPTAIPDEICEGETSQLFAYASGGTGNYSFTWTSDPPGFISTQENPIVTPTVTTTYYVEVFDGFNTASDSVIVTVHPLPVFDCPSYGPVCEGSEVIVFTEPGIFKHNGNWVTNFDPQSPGIYNFTYIETTEFGCSDSCQFQIVVNYLPTVYAGMDRVIDCGSCTTINDAITGGTGVVSYYWTPEEYLLNPTVLHPTTIDLDSTVTLTLVAIDGNGCESFDDVTIYVNETPPATILQAISGPGGNCPGNLATVALEVDNFTDVSSFQLKLKYNSDYLYCEGYSNVNPVLADNLVAWVDQLSSEITFHWDSPQAVSFSTKQTVAELVFTLKQAGQGTLDWYTGETDSYFINDNGVNIPAQFQAGMITIYEPPMVHLVDSIFICENEMLTISGYATGYNTPIDKIWVYPDGYLYQGDPTFTSVQLSDAGDYTLMATDRLGCRDEKTVTLVVYENPEVAIGESDTIVAVPGDPLNAGEGYAYYFWNTGESTQVIALDKEGWYWVTVASEHGCMAMDSIYVMMQEEIPEVILRIPNAFTPDGDGLNDTFKTVPWKPEEITSFKMMIFNRWGEFMWETDDLYEGWPGTKDGILCPGDAYVYKVIWSAAGVPGKAEPQVEAGLVILVQ